LVQRSRLGAVITELPPARWSEIEQALLVACGFRID
jgi:mRNA interferase MazF